jgi:hypothetical protein
LVCDKVGHGLGVREPRSSGARTSRRGRLANQAARAQIYQRIGLVDGHQARDATAAHRYGHLSAVLDVLDVAAEAVAQLADAHLRLQRLGCGVMTDHCPRYIDGCHAIAQITVLPQGGSVVFAS